MLEPRIGYWWAECCEEDLYRIDTAEDLAAVRTRLSRDTVEECGPPAGVWRTREEALAALARWH